VTDTLDVVLVIVTYRSTALLHQLLRSVQAAAGGLTFGVVVVDNDSGDEVETVVDHYPWAKLVRARSNLGYSGGINLGLANVPDARGVCVVNPDVELLPDSLARLLVAAESHGASVPLLCDGDGRVQRSIRREPTVLGAWGEALLGDHLAGRPSWSVELVRRHNAYRRSGPVDWATGAVLMTSREALDAVGGWDDSYFLYAEETDYCRRLRAAGFEVCFEPAAVAIHHGGGSGRSAALTALVAVNRVRYFGRANGRFRRVLFAAAVTTQHVLRSRDPGERAAAHALLSRRVRRRLSSEVRAA
jgi:GT2 family glycosyltransferase